MKLIRSARKTSPPDRLYKFYGPARADIFSTFHVRFSQLAALNDPFEFLINARPGDLKKGAARVAARQTSLLSLIGYAVSAAVRATRENAKLATLSWLLRSLVLAFVAPIAIVMVLLLMPFISRQMRSVMLAAADEMEVLLFKRVREGLVLVFSCSETWKSVPMWAHYAANHTGFAIGIDPGRAFLNTAAKAKTPFVRARKVRYLSREPKMSGDLDIGDFICAKMDHWAYEREWRFIAMPDDAHARGEFVDGHELLLFQLQADSVREVILGANCALPTVMKTLDLLLESGVTPELYQVRQSAGYGFARVRIETVSDLNLQPTKSGPVPNFGDHAFQHLDAAFEDFRRDAERGRLTRWLLQQGR